MLGIAAVALFANAISDAKAERKNDQKGNRGFHKMWFHFIVRTWRSRVPQDKVGHEG